MALPPICLSYLQLPSIPQCREMPTLPEQDPLDQYREVAQALSDPPMEPARTFSIGGRRAAPSPADDAIESTTRELLDRGAAVMIEWRY